MPVEVAVPSPVIAPLALAERAAEAASVMAAAFGLNDTGSGVSTRIQIFRRHGDRPDLISFGAYDEGRLIGFCYGFPGQPGSWWEEQVRPHLRAARAEEWLADSFELVELHVLPAYQRRGIGHTLLTTVCNASDLPKVILSTPTEAAAARRLYARLGFRDITEPFLFGDGGPPYTVMGAALPLPGHDRGA
jgi:ribosomal protein S18 acetylase RimI-like enzyme